MRKESDASSDPASYFVTRHIHNERDGPGVSRLHDMDDVDDRLMRWKDSLAQGPEEHLDTHQFKH